MARAAGRDGGWFDACPAACQTACVYRLGSRRARRLARRLARIGPANDSDRGRPGGLPDSSLVSARRMVRIETGPAACPTARSYRFGEWFGLRRARRLARRLARVAAADGSRRARRLARQLVHGASADGWIETGPAYCPTARSRRFGGWLDRDGPGVFVCPLVVAVLRRNLMERSARPLVGTRWDVES